MAALEELLNKAETETRVLNEEEQAAFGELKAEIGQLDTHLENLRETESIIARSAIRVGPPARDQEPPKLGKGIGIARMVQLLVASRGNDLQAVELAKRHFPDMLLMEQVFRARALGVLQRAAVPAATTTDPAWAGVLVYQNQLASELIELVMPETILGQLEGLRRVPFNCRIPREQALIAQAKWVGQGASKPVGRGSFDFVTVPFTKVALIVLLTEELARFSDPSAELLMRNGLVRSISQFLDTEFLSNYAPVAGVSPGGILNGLPAGQTISSSGAGWEHILSDATQAVSLLTAGLVAPRRPVWIMSPATRTALGFMPNAFGVPAFPSVAGTGTFAGYPVVTSPNVPNGSVYLIDADMILYASDTDIRLDISREASVQADSDPATPPTGMVSLWQQNLIGILAEKYEWWGRARDQAVVVLSGVNWGAPPVTTPPAGSPMAASARGHRAT